MMVGTWGIPGYAGKTNYLAFFPVGLRALATVLRGRKISFPVTPKNRQAGRHLRLVLPQIAVVALTLSAGLWALVALGLGGTGHTLPGVITNALWGLNNCLAMAGMIGAALWQPRDTLDEGACTA